MSASPAPAAAGTGTAGADSRAAPSDTAYTVRPRLKDKFRPNVVKDLIHEVLVERLTNVQYHQENTSQWTKDIADEIKAKLKTLGLDRYKFVVQVVIGEQKGAGFKFGCRAFWDSDSDNYAQDVFMNETLFCVAAAFGVYYY